MSVSARDIALDALGDRAGHVGRRLDALLREADLSGLDRALARELALGVVRRRGTLNAVVRRFLAHPRSKTPDKVMDILRLGLYQMLFLDRVPDFAAVNEAVAQARSVRKGRFAGLVNAVLRNVGRGVGDVEEGRPPIDARVLPVGPAGYRRFETAVFPDPGDDLDGYIAAAHSLPSALVARWRRHLGSTDRALAVATHANARPPLIVRANMLRTTPAQLVRALAAEGVAARSHESPASVVFDQWRDVTALESFSQGLYQPQDPSATAVVLAADPAPGARVLDLCAAPGTKTTHLAERMANRGEIVAADVSETKLDLIGENCARLGIEIVTPRLSESIGSLMPGSFDLVLADVPCSNTGVLARRAEARWRFDPRGLERLVRDQRLLARAAAEFTRPGGRMVYSTCSIEPEEGETVVRWIRRNVSRAKLIRSKRTLPAGAQRDTAWRDGGFVAVFEM